MFFNSFFYFFSLLHFCCASRVSLFFHFLFPPLFRLLLVFPLSVSSFRLFLSLNMRFSLSATILLLPFLLSSFTVSAHMNLAYPYPRGYKLLPGITSASIDYSITSPTTRPCQGKPPAPPVQTFQAGTPIHTRFAGEAEHGGGHCQFALSYDQGNTWVVIHTIKDTCLANGARAYSIPFAENLPASEHAVFAWTWINRMGNREYYWNCVDMTIQSSVSSGNVYGKQLLVANIMNGPTIPEWPAGKPDALGDALLDARKPVMVAVSQGHGSASYGQGSPSMLHQSASSSHDGFRGQFRHSMPLSGNMTVHDQPTSDTSC